jgi:hypothetical protein
MGYTNGPKIVTNGLALMLDTANIKSFRGEPTTNLVTSAAAMSSWTWYYRTISASTFTTEFGTTGYRFLNQPSWNGVYRNFNLVNSGTYTFSAWFRYIGGSSNNNGATVYISNYGGGDTAIGLDKTKVGVWQRVSHTVSVTSPTNVYFYLISYGGTDNGTGNPDFSSWEVTMPQIELKSYATPFVDGTRGTTVATGGGWSDLTGNGNNGELVNTPTFNSNNGGGIVFNGSNTQIIIPEISALNTQTPTVEVWVKTNATSQNGFWFEKGNVNTQYALFQEGANITWRHTTNVGSLTAPCATYMNTSQYAHVVGTYTSGDRRIYVNGVQVASDTLAYTIPTNANGSSIGVYGGYNGGRGYYYDGNIAAVRVYNKTLSSTEVLQNFNATRGRFGI